MASTCQMLNSYQKVGCSARTKLKMLLHLTSKFYSMTQKFLSQQHNYFLIRPSILQNFFQQNL